MEFPLITTEEFDNRVIEPSRLILVAFTAHWCAPFQLLRDNLTEFYELHDSVRIFVAYLDLEPQLFTRFSIVSVPTMLVFKGEALGRFAGVLSAQELQRWVTDLT